MTKETPSPGGIVMIGGPIGAGKTTVAKRVVATWGAPCAYLEGDEFWKFFAQHAPAPSPREAKARDARILVQAMIASAARFARGGYDVIVDFTISPRALPGIRAGLADFALDYVVICPTMGACAGRAAARDEGTIADYAPFADLHGAFVALGPLEPHAIRDDAAEPDELAARIHAGLRAQAYRLPPL